jgi:hypothetical protein
MRNEKGMKGQVNHDVKATCFPSTKVPILTLTRLAGDVVKRVEEEHAQKVAKLNQIKDKLGHVRAYIYIRVCVYIYAYIYMCIYTYIHICTHIFIHIYMYIHIYICMYVYVCTYIHTCIYIYIDVYMYIRIHTYMHTCSDSCQVESN